MEQLQPPLASMGVSNTAALPIYHERVTATNRIVIASRLDTLILRDKFLRCYTPVNVIGGYRKDGLIKLQPARGK